VRFDFAKVEIKLFKKKYSNYCFLIIIFYGGKNFIFWQKFNSLIYYIYK